MKLAYQRDTCIATPIAASLNSEHMWHDYLVAKITNPPLSIWRWVTRDWGVYIQQKTTRPVKGAKPCLQQHGWSTHCEIWARFGKTNTVSSYIRSWILRESSLQDQKLDLWVWEHRGDLRGQWVKEIISKDPFYNMMGPVWQGIYCE